MGTRRFARGALLALGLTAALAAGPRPARPQPPAGAPPTWYAQVLAHSPGGLNVTHFWSYGPRLRAETVVAGRRVVTIVNGEYYYAYDALTNKGVAVERSPEALAHDATGQRPFGNEVGTLLRQGAEKIREEAVLGRPCDVYRVTDRRGRRELWVTQGTSPLPIRVEVYDRVRKRTFSTEYLSLQSGLAVPLEFFEPAPQVQLERYDIEGYYRRVSRSGAAGPVPILYSNLLHGPGR